MEDRARQALHRQALVPVAETPAEENSSGFRAKRGCADAMDQGFKIRRQKNSATWIREGDIKGFFDPIGFEGLLKPMTRNKKVLSKGLDSGYVEEGRFYPTTSGVPQGGVISPVLGNRVLDGLEAIVKGRERLRRANQINFDR